MRKLMVLFSLVLAATGAIASVDFNTNSDVKEVVYGNGGTGNTGVQ